MGLEGVAGDAPAQGRPWIHCETSAQRRGVNDVYIALSSHGVFMPADWLIQLISRLHRAHVGVEAPLSTTRRRRARHTPRAGDGLHMYCGFPRAIMDGSTWK